MANLTVMRDTPKAAANNKTNFIYCCLFTGACLRLFPGVVFYGSLNFLYRETANGQCQAPDRVAVGKNKTPIPINNVPKTRK